jgi:phosphatidylserine/phosphatidylglycerophosphate/cardiolipin synthase-like enzyme
MRALRLLKTIVLGVIAAILGVYLGFAIGLTVLEWVVRENPKVDESLLAHSTAPHLITHFDQGAASFQRRLELIGAARESIALEFFIYDVDDASRLLTQALIERAREGVQVRILVDFSAPVFKLKPAYARLLGEAGVKVRYYNTSAIYRLVSIQHRSHRKLLIIDEATVLTGGRNIANDYFDLSDHYNFLDSDLEVTGPIVKTVLQSFDMYWNSRLATEPTYDSEPHDEAATFVVPQAGDVALLDKLRAAGESYRQSHQAHRCQDLRFVTDFPNQGEKSRNVFNAIVDELRRAKQEAVVESPYFVIKSGGLAVLEDLHQRGVRVRVLTNSLERRFVRRCRALSPARLTGRYRPHALRLCRSTATFAEHQSPRRHAAVGRAFQARGDRRRHHAARHVQHRSTLRQSQFRADAGVPRTKGSGGRGAGKHRGARSGVRKSHRARHDRAAFGPPRKLSADAPDPFSVGDANREPVRLPAVRRFG